MATLNQKTGRDAGTGKFTTVDYAKAHPKTAIVETIKRTVKTPSPPAKRK